MKGMDTLPTPRRLVLGLLALMLAAPALPAVADDATDLRRVEQAMGVLLILTGLVFVLGWIPFVAQWLLETFPALGRIG